MNRLKNKSSCYISIKIFNKQILLSQKENCKKSTTTTIKQKSKEKEVTFYIVENMDEKSIDLNHMVYKEIDAVHLF